MGNTTSFVNKAPLYSEDSYTPKKLTNDLRYGTNIKLISNKQNPYPQHAILHKTFNEKSQWESRVSELKFRMQLEHINLTKLINYNSDKEDQFCSVFYQTNALYEYYTNDLKQEILERQKADFHYKEEEIWYIIHSLSSVSNYLASKDVNHGDIRPFNVLLTSSGQIKLGEMYTHPQPYSSYTQLLCGMSQDYYISPQLLKGLQVFQEVPEYDRPKNEIYTIGMTALNAATLENTSEKCYDQQNLVLQKQNIEGLLDKVRQRYSQKLGNTIQSMLLENEEQRISLEDLQTLLQKDIKKSDRLNMIEIVRTPQQKSSGDQNNHTIICSCQQNNYSNDELMKRIQQVLAMSNETINKYGSETIIQTETVKNNNSEDWIRKTSYQNENADVVKRSKNNAQVAQFKGENVGSPDRNMSDEERKQYILKIVQDARSAQQLGNGKNINAY